MENHEWIVERFDRIDNDNKDIKDELKIVSQTVTKHSAYWDITKAIGVGALGLAGAAATFFWPKN